MHPARTFGSRPEGRGDNPPLTQGIFAHAAPALYDRYMGPLLFEPYAKLLAERCALLHPDSILETAAGTGIATRAVHREAPGAQIVATDINPLMLEFAMQALRSERVLFQLADAQNLPFADQSFDLTLCQFGVMFFPDRIRAYREARRVLRANGHYLIVVFNRLRARLDFRPPFVIRHFSFRERVAGPSGKLRSFHRRESEFCSA